MSNQNHETIVHSTGAHGDGVYGANVRYTNACSSRSCLPGGMCLPCFSLDSMDVEVRLYAEQQLRVMCELTLVRQNDVVPLFTFRRLDGQVMDILPTSGSGCSDVSE